MTTLSPTAIGGIVTDIRGQTFWFLRWSHEGIVLKSNTFFEGCTPQNEQFCDGFSWLWWQIFVVLRHDVWPRAFSLSMEAFKAALWDYMSTATLEGAEVSRYCPLPKQWSLIFSMSHFYCESPGSKNVLELVPRIYLTPFAPSRSQTFILQKAAVIRILWRSKPNTCLQLSQVSGPLTGPRAAKLFIMADVNKMTLAFEMGSLGST